ncbi:Uncharacterised protein [Mycobacteroides abscessus subsp. abscessus]|nr:Uncharacterised protein [Mycobacteroides abscessus subsp. abscessus]
MLFGGNRLNFNLFNDLNSTLTLKFLYQCMCFGNSTTIDQIRDRFRDFFPND